MGVFSLPWWAAYFHCTDGSFSKWRARQEEVGPPWWYVCVGSMKNGMWRNEVWWSFVGEDGSNAEPVRKNVFLWSQVLCRRKNIRKRYEWIGRRKSKTAGERVFSSWHQIHRFHGSITFALRGHFTPLRSAVAQTLVLCPSHIEFSKMTMARRTSRQIHRLGRQEVKRRLAEHLCNVARAQWGPRGSTIFASISMSATRNHTCYPLFLC